MNRKLCSRLEAAMAVPTDDLRLVPYSTNFNTRIVADPLDFSLSASQATAYTALHTPYIAAMAAIASPGAKSRALVADKNAAKELLLPYARELYALVQASQTVTNANKELLGVVVRSEPQPIPAPAVVPAMDVISVVGRTVRLRIHDADGEGKRSKPAGVKGAVVCSYVGPVAPSDPELYKWEGNTTRSIFEVTFPDSVAPGTLVHFTSMWFSDRQANGPACDPISAYIQFGMSGAAA
jgi:hypothetical protein